MVVAFHRLPPNSTSFLTVSHLFPSAPTSFHLLFKLSQTFIHFSCDFHEHPDRVRSSSIGFNIVVSLFRWIEAYRSRLLLPLKLELLVGNVAFVLRCRKKLELDLSIGRRVEVHHVFDEVFHLRRRNVLQHKIEDSDDFGLTSPVIQKTF